MMLSRKYVAYYRVSTAKQGASGLGLEAQERLVHDFLNGAPLVGSFTEVETGKGSNALDRRPQLRAALEMCRKNKATLVIAKIDRLARNTTFVCQLLESGIDFKAADMPTADPTMIRLFTVMAEWEREQTASRTRAALAAAKARGVQLGRMGPLNLKRNIEERQAKADEFANNLVPMLEGFRTQGMSQVRMVEALNRMQVPAARGGQWGRSQLQRVLVRIDAAEKNPATNDASTIAA